MPGYVFLSSQGWPLEWHQVLGAHFVRRVISLDRDPIRLRIGEMDELQEREHDGEFIAWSAERHMRTNREFKIGDRVEIVIGPLTGRRAKVVEINDARANVLTEMLGQERFVEVGLEVLEAVN